MNKNHATPQPTPKPLCAIFEPMLPLLRTHGLTPDERASLEAHLADCAWCQNQLTTLDVVDAALRRHYTSVPATTAGSGLWPRVRPSLTLEDIIIADQEETNTATATREPPTPIRQLTPVQRRLTALGAIAAVLVLAVLAASLFSYFGARGTGPAVKPTPTHGLDAQSQAYFAVLDTYFRPMSNHLAVTIGCEVNDGPHPTRAQDCQPAETVALTDMQAFADHLTVAPPARWQTEDAQIKQVNQTAIPLWASFAASQSASDWDQRREPADAAVHLYCDPITQINDDLLAAGLPLSSQLGCNM